MIKTLIDLFKNKDTRAKILFTLAMLFVFRVGAAITVPGIDTSKLISGLSGNSLVTMMNIIGAGSWQTFSIFSMVLDHTLLSIVVELLAMDIIPPLAELKRWAKGRQQLDKITRYVAVVLGFI